MKHKRAGRRKTTKRKMTGRTGYAPPAFSEWFEAHYGSLPSSESLGELRTQYLVAKGNAEAAQAKYERSLHYEIRRQSAVNLWIDMSAVKVKHSRRQDAKRRL